MSKPTIDSTHQRSRGSDWQIPRGVSAGNWDYVRASQIALGYDQFLQDDPLSVLDRQIVNHYLPPLDSIASRCSGLPNAAPCVVDLGCGTGRTLLPLLESGYHGIGVDLSLPMLFEIQQKYKALKSSLPRVGKLSLLQANLVELSALASDSADHVISLFSTLGMIQRRDNRAACVAHVARILKPGGRFILHAHNVWYQARHPGGFRWILTSGFGALRGPQEFGDRTANYRGVNAMFIHSFRRSELQRLIHGAGLEIAACYGVEPGVTEPRLASRRRALRIGGYVGWIFVCQKPDD